MAQLMPLPLTVSCFTKIQIGFTFLVPAHLGSPGKRAVKRVCVCVCASGLEEVLSIMFGSNTAQHVLSGKAYARALRVHFLVHGALTYILMQILQRSCCCDDNVLCSVDLDPCLSAEDVAEVSAAVVSGQKSYCSHLCY